MNSSPAAHRTHSYGLRRWRALGTYVVLILADELRIERARRLADQLLQHIDATCSRFREDSDLCRANRYAGSWVGVDPMLIQAVKAALDAARASSGLVDPTLGRQLVELGYDRDIDLIRSASDPDGAAHQPTLMTQTADPAALPNLAPLQPGWWDVNIQGDNELFVPAGAALDLGATGKAFAADLISTQISAELGVGCLISLGGDISIGAGDEGEHPWQIAVSERPDDPVAETLSINSGGAATSTVLARTWKHQGRQNHHLLDPTTGSPIQAWWRTATVVAPSCLAANTSSTAALVLGEKAEEWLIERGHTARLVDRTGRVVYVGSWPGSGLAPEPSGECEGLAHR